MPTLRLYNHKTRYYENAKHKDRSQNTCITPSQRGPEYQAYVKTGTNTRDGRHTLLLQPQTKIEELRLRLCENGYAVTREHLVRDQGKLYVVMTVTAGERYTPGAEQLYGGLALEREALYGDYLAHQIARLRRRAEGLRQSGSGEADGFAALADALEAKKGKWEHDNGT